MKKLTQQLLVPIICLLCSSYSIAQIKAYPTDSIITHQREAIFHTLTLSETYTNKEINLLCYGNHFNDKATVKLNYTAKNTIKTKIKDAVSRDLFSKTKRSPMILPVIMVM